MSLRALVPSLILVPACFVDAGVSPPDLATTTATTSSPTTEPTTTGPEDPLTTTAATAPTDDTDDPPDTSVDTNDPPAAPCWDLDADGWPQIGDRLEIGGADPFLSPDGLTLHYLDLDAQRPHRSTRTSRTAPFSAGTRLAKWSFLPFPIRFPTVLQGGELMLMAMNQDIAYSLRTDDPDEQYETPTAVPGDVNTILNNEIVLTATADGSLLIVQRDDGPPIPPLESSYRFLQFTRNPADTKPEFTDGHDVTPYVDPLGFAACPVLSPDGLRLFFTSTDAETLAFDQPETLAIYSTSRATITSGWTAPLRLGGLRGATSEEGVVCVSSVTEDGCELTYYTFIVGKDGPPTLYIAERTP